MLIIDLGACGNGFHEPDVSADYASPSDCSSAAEDSRSGIDHHVIFYVGMTFHALDGIAVLVKLEAFCAERHALIQLDVTAYHAGFTYYDSGAVVDEEIISYNGSGMDVDAGELMSVLCHYPRDERHSELEKTVCYPVYGHCFDRWIA